MICNPITNVGFKSNAVYNIHIRTENNCYCVYFESNRIKFRYKMVYYLSNLSIKLYDL